VDFKVAYIILILTLFLSCNAEKGKGTDKKIVQTYAEILFLTEKFRNDSIKLKQEIDSLLKSNNLTMSQVDSITTEYSKDPKRWAEFFDEVKKHLDEKSLNAQKKYR